MFSGSWEEEAATLEDGAERCDMNKMLQAEEGDHEPRIWAASEAGKGKITDPHL